MPMNNSKYPPTVSIFMPVYNQEKLVSESIESVISQDYDDWELIVGDDCSTDNTFEIAESYRYKYPEKIITFKNPQNLGITKNCNKVLAKCTGKYIAYTAGDDVFLPNKLSEQVALMDTNENCILSYHDVEVFESETGKTIRHFNSGEKCSHPITGDSKKIAEALIKYDTRFMAALSIMTKRELIPSEGYDERIPVASDWFMWIEICARNSGEVLFLDGVYAKYRKHKSSITNNSKDHREDMLVTLALAESRYRFLTKNIQRRRAHLYYRRAIEEIHRNNFSVARLLLRESRKSSNISWKKLRWWIISIYKHFICSIK